MEHRRILLDGAVVEVTRDGDDLVAPDGRRVAADAAAHLPPVSPTKILCCHLNHVSRVREFQISLPPAPTWFHKPVSALNSHGGAVVRPANCRYLNYEGEIAIVIGRTTRNVSLAQAADHIAGYTIANDFGLHDFRDTDAGSMLRVKGADTMCPVGPGLVTGWDSGRQVDAHAGQRRRAPVRLHRRDGLADGLPRRRPGEAHHARPGRPHPHRHARRVAAGRARRRRHRRGRGARRADQPRRRLPHPGLGRGRRAAHRHRGGPARRPWAATGSTAGSAGRCPPTATSCRARASPRGTPREPRRRRRGLGLDRPLHRRRASLVAHHLRGPLAPRLVPQAGRRRARRSGRGRGRGRRGGRRVPGLGRARPRGAPRAPAPPRRPHRRATSRASPRSSASTWGCSRRACACASSTAPRATSAPTPTWPRPTGAARWDSNGTHNEVQRMPAGPTVGHHAVERALHALDLEVRAGAGRGQHRRAQARRVVAARRARS